MNTPNNNFPDDQTPLEQALRILMGEWRRVPALLEQIRSGQETITAKLDALIEGQMEVGAAQQNMGRILEALYQRQDLLEDASHQRARLTDEHFDLHVLDPMARQIISIYDLVSESLGPQASHNPSNNDGVANGVRALLLNLLATHGIEPINANPGDKLDARHMRPMLTCDTHNPCLDGTVHELVRPGFRRGIRVLRVAQVIVYRLNNKIERTDKPEHTQEQEQ